ncbi:MAG: VOC family protein [Actinobacteria bacterium]|nr:VOC family protein [Actinomycetota bacterium]
MGKRKRYEPGTFCWVDLVTTDPAGAKAFYGELFGWEAEDVPAGEAGTYTMLRLGGDEVGGLYEMDAERREQGIPPHWFSYVSVEDADVTASRARELGGMVYGEAFDVGGDGRMAVIGDPTGAMLGAWQPRAHIGARRVNDLGCFTWNELQARDPETAADFYAGLFGWETEPQEQDGQLAYVTIRNADSQNGGMMPMTEQHGDVPNYWLTYFTVPSCDDAVARVRELGGEVLAGPMNVGAGRISVVSDPQGAAFALFEGETDD